MQVEFRSSDLGRVLRIWRKNLKRFNDRLTIRPKDSGGFWKLLSSSRPPYAEVFVTVDGGTMLTFTYRQHRSLNELLAEAHITLPEKLRIIGTEVNQGEQVTVVRIAADVPTETRLQFIIQVLEVLSEEMLPDTFTAITERMSSSAYPYL